MKLPKQWRHWCKLAGLRPEGGHGQGNWRWVYLIGRGRRWRLNCYNQFQMSVPLKEFDRWANSVAAFYARCPQTEREFLTVVNTMVTTDPTR